MAKTHYEKVFAYVVQAMAAVIFFTLVCLEAFGKASLPVMIYGLLAGIALGVGKLEDFISLGKKK